MRYQLLGRSGLSVSTVGLGCWPLSGRHWGVVKDEESVEAINQAREMGVNFFDTADVYGFGHSEELLGKTIGNDQNIVLATKVGLRWTGKRKIRHDLSADYIKRACEASLRRLNRDVIDLYQIHWPDPAIAWDETVSTLNSLVTEGKVRYVGACNLPIEKIESLSQYSWFVAYQGLFHLLDLTAKEEIIPVCSSKNLAFIAYEPLAKGLLTGKFKDTPVFELGDHRKYEDRFTSGFADYQKKVAVVKDAAAEHNLTAAQLSLALLLYYGATMVVPGAKTAAQIKENAQACEIDRDLLEKLEPEIIKLL